MVIGLPLINIPTEVYEECVQAKQHKGSFSKDVGYKTNLHFEVVYYDVCGSMQLDSIGSNMYFVTFMMILV